MKHYFATANGLGRRLRGLAAVVALSLCGVCGAKAQAYASPVGTTWDCIISGGHQAGIAFLNFTNNATATNSATFGGYQILTALRGAGGPDATGRNVGGDVGRGLGTSDSSISGSTNSQSTVFGFMPVFGYWRFDDRGRVIGYFPEYINAVQPSTNLGPMSVSTNFTSEVVNGNQDYLFSTNLNFAFTNSVYATNIVWALESNSYTNIVQFTNNGDYEQRYVVNNGNQIYSFTTNLTVTLIPPATSTNVELVWTTPSANYSLSYVPFWVNTNIIVTPFSADSTNQVSFTASVTAGRRLALSSPTPTGRVSYSGVPMKYDLPDLTGSWYADKKSGSTHATEFFTLGKTVVPNIYMATNGSGPGYEFTMITMASAQRRVGFVFSVQQGGGTNNVLGATVGSISYGRRAYKGSTTGNLEPSSSIGYTATFVLP